MAIRAVVLDIGGVLEVIDDAVFPGPWPARLGLSVDAAAALEKDYWRWYVGTLDRRLFDWFAGQRRHRRTGILSNSGPGARERERHHGFESIVDDLVYSHEVGLAKPDPEAYALTAERLDVRPHEVLFLDDVAVNVDAARGAGWHAVLHEATGRSIVEMERIIAER